MHFFKIRIKTQTEQLEKEKAKEAALNQHRAESNRKRQKLGLTQEQYDEIVRHEVTPPCYVDEKGNSVSIANSSSDGLRAVVVSRWVKETLKEPHLSEQKTKALEAEAKKKREREKVADDKEKGRATRPKLKSVTNTRNGLCLTGDSTLGGLLAVNEGNAAAEAEAVTTRDAKAAEEAVNTGKILQEAHRKFSANGKLNATEKIAVVIAYRKFRGADKKRLTDIHKSMKKGGGCDQCLRFDFIRAHGWTRLAMGIDGGIS